MKNMAGEINKLIPLYGELNRIYSDFIVNRAFSFDKHKEQYTLILNSLKIEIEKEYTGL